MAKCFKYHDCRSKSSHNFPLKIAISHKRERRYISTGIYLKKEQWDDSKKKIKSNFKNSGRANTKINKMLVITEETLDNLKPQLNQLTAAQLKIIVENAINEELKRKTEKNFPELTLEATKATTQNTHCFFNYARKLADHMYLTERGSSADVIINTVLSLENFTQKKTLTFTELTPAFLRDYERWYLNQFNNAGRKNTINGFGFRAKEIRRIFNMAIRDPEVTVAKDLYPFGRYGYSIKKEKTANRNINPKEIAKLYSLDLTNDIKLNHHLNYFKYYFECWGMNFIDLAYLRVHQVQNGRLNYRRRKTRWSNNAKKFDIPHSTTAQSIIDYYTQGKASKDFVFPILGDIYHLTKELKDKKLELEHKKLFDKKLRNIRANHNRRLKTIAKKAGLTVNLTTYVSRHSFFSIALERGVSKSEISELAGHANMEITETYLAGFSDKQLSASANLVRSAISDNNTNSLDNLVELNKGATNMKVGEFLESIWTKKSDATQLIIALLQKTNCKDATLAQEYAKLFMFTKSSN